MWSVSNRHFARTLRTGFGFIAFGVALGTVSAGAVDNASGSGSAETAYPPSGFVHAAAMVDGLVEEIRYFGNENFVGEPIDGYLAPRCILADSAAQALRSVQERANSFGLALKVYDCYRPAKAVAHFVRWAKDLSDTRRKADYYPDVHKSRLFEEGYIAERSGHSRGATVDLTLIDAVTGAELDMGTGFDLFGPSSWPVASNMSPQQRANRMLLQTIMLDAGFKPYPQEWWHFTLDNEPYPDTYFEFDVR